MRGWEEARSGTSESIAPRPKGGVPARGALQSVLSLQRAVGNRTVAAMLGGTTAGPVVQREDDVALPPPMAFPMEAEAETNPNPCFEDQQKETIRSGAGLADVAKAELDKRPPDFRVAHKDMRAAVDTWKEVGGYDPGESALRSAQADLRRVADSVEVYITPVGRVLSVASQVSGRSAADALDAAEMAVPRDDAPGSALDEPAPGP